MRHQPEETWLDVSVQDLVVVALTQRPQDSPHI